MTVARNLQEGEARARPTFHAGDDACCTSGKLLVPGVMLHQDFHVRLHESVEKAMANGIANKNIPAYLIEQKVLADKIIGYDEANMKVLYKRITNFLLTGE